MRRLLLLLMLLAVPASAAIVTSEVVLVDPTADLQAAIDNTPEGGTLSLGVGVFTAPDGGLRIGRSIVIEGSGTMGRGLVGADSLPAAVYGTVLEPFSSSGHDQPVLVIEAPGGTAVLAYKGISVVLRGLTFNGKAMEYESGSYGLVCDLDSLSILRELRIEDCSFTRLGDDAIHLEGLDGAGSAIVGAFLDNVRVWGNYGNGFYVKNATSVNCTNSSFADNYKLGVNAITSGVRFINTGFESNGNVEVYSEAEDAQLFGYQCNVFMVQGCHFENFDGAIRNGVVHTSCKGITASQCWGLSLTSNLFVNGTFTPDTAAYGNEGNGVRPIRTYEANHAIALRPGTYGTPGTVSGNFFHGCYYGVTVYPLGDGVGVYGADIFNQSFAWADGCDLPITGSAGFGLPKINPAYVPTTMQCDTVYNQSNAEGMMYWDTTNRRIIVWDGTAWKTITLSAVTP